MPFHWSDGASAESHPPGFGHRIRKWSRGNESAEKVASIHILIRPERWHNRTRPRWWNWIELDDQTIRQNGINGREELFGFLDRGVPRLRSLRHRTLRAPSVIMNDVGRISIGDEIEECGYGEPAEAGNN